MIEDIKVHAVDPEVMVYLQVGSNCKLRLGTDDDFVACDKCSLKEADIFNVMGNYCCDCWQTETDPGY
jgi:hypothetical protein